MDHYERSKLADAVKEKKYAKRMEIPSGMRLNEDPNHYRTGIIHNEKTQ